MAKAPDEENLTPEQLAAQQEKLADLIDGLKQAKRKPRHFAIVANGMDIMSLQVQKKPFREGPLKKERRDEGGRQIYEGVCQGTTGSTIEFKFEDALPKIKETQLKRYIGDKTGLAVKPVFGLLAPPPK